MRLRIAALLLALPSCTGCFTIDIYAPKNQEVVLISGKEPAETKREWRTWFGVWGLAPADNTMPADIIRNEQLTEVRITTVDTLSDLGIGVLYNYLLPIGLGVQSMKVEGRSAPARQ